MELSHTWGDLADRGGVPTITLITIGALDEDSAVTETLCKHLSSDVVQPHAATLEGTETDVTVTLTAAADIGLI